MTPTTPFSRWAAVAREGATSRRREVGIPMRDGVELAADVWLPAEDGPVPCIVEPTPYGKDNMFNVADAELLQGHGYAFVSVDVRGRGKSEGEWTAFVNDPDDCHDAVEWVAAQDWSTGKVGMTGLSYMGWVQWAAASRRPAHLTCLVSTSAAGRWQQEIPYTNGAFQLYFAWWTYATRRRIPEGGEIDWERVLSRLPYGDLGEFINGRGGSWEMLSQHDRLDDTWKAVRFDDLYSQIDVPCLHVSGWYDLEDLLGAFHHYENMRAHSPAADDQYLLVGPWSHVGSRFPSDEYGGVALGPDAALDMDAEHVRWFDHWLKGTGPGIEDLARVRVFEPGHNRWREAPRWPLSNDTLDLFLAVDGDDGVLVDEPRSEEQARGYRYDPLDPALTGIDVTGYPVENPPLDQSVNEARPDVLTFTGEPLAEDLVISGWAHLKLYASSDCDDTEWHVKIADVTPEGTSLKVTQGCLRAACRDSLTDLAPLTPGTVTPFDIELWPTHHAFRAGHRVRVTVTSSDYPWFARSLNQFGLVSEQGEPKVATNTVACGGEYPSHIELPVERAG
ncbi:MAG TPA: CocE/NonD family hydrolase [Solirubrobacteraceae bacterium]